MKTVSMTISDYKAAQEMTVKQLDKWEKKLAKQRAAYRAKHPNCKPMKVYYNV